jgi:outer membrane protein OmpA-like peptidoglycan-associated protein/tetratricopeptide (TPR) repeat protein
MPAMLLAQSSNISTLFTSNFDKAELLYHQFAYRNALQLYLVVSEKDPANQIAKQRIADCYVRLGNIQAAEKLYAELTLLPDTDPDLKYKYAQLLSMQEKYAEAKKWYGETLHGISSDLRAAPKLDFFRYLKYYLRDSTLYGIKNENFNSDQSDFGPQYFNDGVVFVSARSHDKFVKRQSAAALNDKEAMLNIFYTPLSTDAGKDAIKFFHHDLNSPYHDGPVSFYNNRTQFVFSRTNLIGNKPVDRSGRVNLNLYFAKINDRNEVSDINPFPFNRDAFSISHPWISEDGTTLYFASDMPGGEGGTDIYKTEKKNGRWELPQNAGPNVNSAGDEFYPFLGNDTTLFFSSNGHGGLGGLDLYLSYLRGSNYTLPKNLGFPLNTSSDDFSLILDKTGRRGMFASNRKGSAGYDDIYNFSVRSFFLIGKVILQDEKTKAIDNVRVMLKEKAGGDIETGLSDSTGNFYFDIDFDRDYILTAAKEGYTFSDTVRFSTHSRGVGYDTVEIALNKHSLFVKGSVYSNESQGKLSNATVTLKNLTDGRIDSIATNPTGSYNFLVKPNKKYQIHARKEGFLPKEINLNTQGLDQKVLLNDFLLEEEFIDKAVIQFDFGRAGIRENEIPKLKKLYEALSNRPNTKLLVSAFADSKGTKQFNQTLSDKRVNSVIKFFTSLGLDNKRIEGKGFGETLLLKGCSDGVECNEEEHAINRRAEIKMKLEN